MRLVAGQLACLHQLNVEVAYPEQREGVLSVHSRRCATVYGIYAYDVNGAQRALVSARGLA
jgi:hypothetical protein